MSVVLALIYPPIIILVKTAPPTHTESIPAGFLQRQPKAALNDIIFCKFMCLTNRTTLRMWIYSPRYRFHACSKCLKIRMICEKSLMTGYNQCCHILRSQNKFIPAYFRSLFRRQPASTIIWGAKPPK